MAEVIWLITVLSPFLLMWWLVSTRRRAQRKAAQAQSADAELPPLSADAYEELEQGADGLKQGRRYDGDGAVLPPDQWDGEGNGIRALQGRK